MWWTRVDIVIFYHFVLGRCLFGCLQDMMLNTTPTVSVVEMEEQTERATAVTPEVGDV